MEAGGERGRGSAYSAVPRCYLFRRLFDRFARVVFDMTVACFHGLRLVHSLWGSFCGPGHKYTQLMEMVMSGDFLFFDSDCRKFVVELFGCFKGLFKVRELECLVL
jgi:hypothetical protein